MVVDITKGVEAVIICLTPSSTNRFHGCLLTHCPHRHIQTVYGLLYDTVPAEPCVASPVAKLSFPVTPTLLTFLLPNRSSVVGRVNRTDIPDGTFKNLVENRTLWIVVSPAKA